MKKYPSLKKLVLFDVDGTLVRTTNVSIDIWMKHVHEVFREVYTPIPPFYLDAVNGKIERQFYWEFAQSVGIGREEFLEKYPQAKQKFIVLFEALIARGDVTFSRIDTAYHFAKTLTTLPQISTGLITGNTKEAASMKLGAAGFDIEFPVGGYGDEADTRTELVTLAINKAMKYFSHTYTLGQVIVIGDTAHDITAAKQAGARAIGVTTGFGDTASHASSMKSAGADIVVGSLIDTKVMEYIGI